MKSAARRVLSLAILMVFVGGFGEVAHAQAPQPLGQRFRAAVGSLKQRFKVYREDRRALRRPVKDGSVATYLDHCKVTGRAACSFTESKARNGRVSVLQQPRQLAGVTTSRKGLRRYLNHVGRNTVELLYNDHSSEYGHMLVRVGDKFYELGNVRQAGSGPFTSKVANWDGLVGMVYNVDVARIPAIQARLEQVVQATTRDNLPPFDSYGNPVKLKPVGGTGSGPQRYEVVNGTRAGNYRASGQVVGRRVVDGSKTFLEASNGLRVPVSGAKADGTLSVDSRSCMSFITKPLAELAPELGLGQLSSYGQRYARSAVTNIVRGDTPAVPSLVTVYSRTPQSNEQLLQRVWDVGKKGDR